MVAEIRAQQLLHKTKNSSVATVINVLIDTALCIATFFMIAYIEQTMLISLALSFIVGLICVFRYDGFKKFFKTVNQNEISQKTLEKLKGYENLFNKNSLILCLFDFVTTAIIILTLGIYAQATATAIIGLIVKGGILTVRIGNNAIQIGKLTRALRAIALVSGTYAIARNKNFLKGGQAFMEAIKNVFKWLWANKKSITGTLSVLTVSVFGVLEGTNTFDVISQIPALMVQGVNLTPILFYAALAILCLVGVFGKGFEKIKTFFVRIGILKEQKAEAKANAEIEKIAAAQLKAEAAAKQKADTEAAEKRKLEIIAELKSQSTSAVKNE